MRSYSRNGYRFLHAHEFPAGAALLLDVRQVVLAPHLLPLLRVIFPLFPLPNRALVYQGF